MKEETEPGTNAWTPVMTWVGRATALIGLFASLAGGVTWLVRHHMQHSERAAKMALARAQAEQGDYQASLQTDAEMLKADPAYHPALDQELSTAMLWVEDFHIVAEDDQNASALAAAALDQIMTVLDAGLTRAKGAQAADAQAHIGWAHWLNQHIAQREFGPAAEQNFRAALTLDPSNVYANAMLGNWMLQNNGDFADAIHHFQTAISTGNARPFVRRLELGGLIYLDKKGARAELVKTANEMRKSGEPLDNENKGRILGYCFDPGVTDDDELAESLSAVPPDEDWKTYLWLDDNPENTDDRRVLHEFIHANLLEVSGNRAESLATFRLLQQELKDSSSSMKDSVDTAVTRLSHS